MSMARKKQVLSGKSGKVFSRVEPRHKRELVKILIEMVSKFYGLLTFDLG